jgi:hypothetical protein
MAKYYTQYWSRANCDYYRDERHQEGEPLNHTAGELFMERAVREGDFIYIVTIGEGILYLVAKVEVLKIVSQEEAEILLRTTDLWNATWHVIAKSGTPLRFDRQVPLQMTKELRFLSTGGHKPLKFISATELDRQALRGVRYLTSASAAELDKLLLEGMVKFKIQTTA